MNAEPSRRHPQLPDPQRESPVPRREDPARPHLRVAPDVFRRRRRARLAVWGVTAISVASLFVLVAFHVFAVQYAFQLDRLDRARVVEERRYERLRADVATRSSPDAVVAAAQALGLVPAERIEYLEVPEAAPRGQKLDRTAQTLDQTNDEAKPALGDNS